MNSEYGVFIVKPDGVEQGIHREFINSLVVNKVKIIDVRRKKLARSEVQEGFFTAYDEYARYLTEGDSIGIFEQIISENCYDYIYDLKMDFRSKHSVSKNTMKNLVHSSDDGLEYYLQRNIFFKEYNNSRYCLSSDLLTYAGNLHDMLRTIQKSNLQKIIIWADAVSELDNYFLLDDFLDVKYAIRNIITTTHLEKVELFFVFSGIELRKNKLAVENKDLSGAQEIMIGHILNKKFPDNFDWKEFRGSPLDYFEYIKNEFDKYFKNIYTDLVNVYSVSSMLIESPLMNIQEAVPRYFFAEGHKLKKAGGSYLNEFFGQYSVSSEYANNFFEKRRNNS